MSSYRDASPNMGSKKSKGMKNEDGRLMGSAWNKQSKSKQFNDKSVGVMPNEGLKKLPKAPGKHLDEGAY